MPFKTLGNICKGLSPQSISVFGPKYAETALQLAGGYMRDENEMAESARSNEIQSEIRQIRESVELARSDIRRAKDEVLRVRNEQASHVRRMRVLWAIVILLGSALAALSWYGAPILNETHGLFGKMPMLQSSLDGLSTRLSMAEQQASAWANDGAALSDRMSKIEQTFASTLKAARNETRSMTEQTKRDVAQRIQTVQDNQAQSMQALQNQVHGVESIQREHAEEVERLRSELTGVRQQLAAVREENLTQGNQIQQLEQSRQSMRNDLSGVDNRVASVDRKLASNQSAVGALASQVNRQRVDFELPNGSKFEVADGIYVTVNHANVEHQQVDGWVQIARDGRFVMLRHENAQRPVVFASRADARTYQLVFTQIGKNETAGYLLAPMSSSATAVTGGN
jgi:chromosome segregation ATPase